MGSVEERDKVAEALLAEAPPAASGPDGVDETHPQAVKSRILARTFHLPNELVLKDFTCAVYQTMLLHGRMYVSHNFVCFYSHFLGNEQISFKISSIRSLERKYTALIFPNALEFTLHDGTQYFFASFIFRQDAFDIITELMGENKQEFDDASSSAAPLQSSMSSIPTEDESTNSERDVSFLDSVENDLPPLSASIVDNLECPDSPPADSAPADPPNLSGSVGEESLEYASLDSELQSGAEPVSPQLLESENWRDVSLSQIGEQEFPLSVTEFFEFFWSDSASKFSISDHLEELEMCDICIHPWAEDEVLAGVLRRQIRMRASMKDIPWASSKKTRVVQDNVCLRLPESFHMRCEVKSLDAPFGDSFLLLVAYDVGACGPDLLQCRLLVRCGVSFSKAIWGMKGVIASRGVAETTRSVELWIESALRSLSPSPSSPLLPRASAATMAQAPLPKAASMLGRLRGARPSARMLAISALLLHILLIVLVIAYGQRALSIASMENRESRALHLLLLQHQHQPRLELQLRLESMQREVREIEAIVAGRQQLGRLRARVRALTKLVQMWSRELDRHCFRAQCPSPQQQQMLLQQLHESLARLQER